MPFRIDRIVVTTIALILFLLPFMSYGDWLLNIACVVVLMVYAVWQVVMIVLLMGTKYQKRLKHHQLNLIYAVVIFSAALIPTKLIPFYIQQQVDQFIVVVNSFKEKNGYFPTVVDISADYEKVQTNVPQFIYQREGRDLASLEFPEPGMAVDSLIYDFSSQHWLCSGNC